LFGNPSVDLLFGLLFTFSFFPFPLETLAGLVYVRPRNARGFGFANLRVSRPEGDFCMFYAFKSPSHS
jgi:hypothetical protein